MTRRCSGDTNTGFTKLKLKNHTLEGVQDERYVAMFQKLLEFARARLEYARDKLEGWSDVSDTPPPNTKMEP